MASRLMQKRILSLLTSRHPQTSLRKEFSWQFLPTANSFFSRDVFYKRNQSLAESNKQAFEDSERHKPRISELDPNTAKGLSDPNSSQNSSVTYNAVSNLKTSSRHDLAMVFTCKVCETRSMKTVCRESYEKGVVVARCDGCLNLHLIADRLGWFGEPGSIEELLAARGEEVKKGSVDTLNLTLEDLAGKKS